MGASFVTSASPQARKQSSQRRASRSRCFGCLGALWSVENHFAASKGMIKSAVRHRIGKTKSFDSPESSKKTMAKPIQKTDDHSEIDASNSTLEAENGGKDE